ncbi:MAG: phosphopantothenoylcysteine decarboxylase [Alphaproteobacteria bacterium]
MKALVTAGPTLEKIDPVRYISNFSSGKQGYAIAKALLDVGFDVTLISGPTNLPPIEQIKIIKIESAEEMLKASLAALPVDIAIFTAAVCDWKIETQSTQKLKKETGIDHLNLKLVKNPDILKIVSNLQNRPKTVVGFAAETNNIIENAKKKLIEKNCDIIIANSVAENNSAFGSDENEVYFITKSSEEYFAKQSKHKIGSLLVEKIISLNKL